MTQKSLQEVRNRLLLRGVEKEARVSETEVNYEQMSKAHGIAKSIIPTFNHDRLFFTPAFLLPTDQKYYLQNQTFQRFQFKEKIERNLELINDQKNHKLSDSLKIAVPNTNYCQICQLKYDNYVQHTTSDPHLQTAKNNPINHSIQQLCNSFNKNKEKEQGHFKSKAIKKVHRTQKQEHLPIRHISKEENNLEGSDCFNKSLNHSTALREKEEPCRGV